jgi:SAM-dependent methyltransferase
VNVSDYKAVNRARWDELTAIHVRSAFYNLDAFKAGQSSLRPIERAELDDVAGRSLLHLQCHFGQDTLSWARLGAKVTGVDFSEQAIALARSLNQELRLDARFLCSDIYDLPRVVDEQFDIVFTSYGVLTWLPDLRAWGRIIAHSLKPGGVFYIVEVHPFAFVLDSGKSAGELRVAYSYFYTPEPLRWEAEGTYADRSAAVRNKVSYDWTHSLGDVLNALTAAGLCVEFLHEFPYCVCGILPGMIQSEDGWWRLPECPHAIPMLFSLKATKRG